MLNYHHHHYYTVNTTKYISFNATCFSIFKGQNTSH